MEVKIEQTEQRRVRKNNKLGDVPSVYKAGKEFGFNTVSKDKEGDYVAAFNDGVNRQHEDKATPWQVGSEWLTGKGPLEHHFNGGDQFTELLRQHEHIEETRQQIISGIANNSIDQNKSYSNNYNLAGIAGVPKYAKDYSTLTTMGKTGNLAVTYLGSYSLTYTVTCVDINNKIAELTVYSYKFILY